MTLISELEALTVGPDEVLILRVPEETANPGFLEGINQALEHVGLTGRALIIAGHTVTLSKIQVSDQLVEAVAARIQQPAVPIWTGPEPAGREPNTWQGEGAA